MKPHNLKTSLISLVRSQVPTFIWGSPGVGKSSVVRQVCEELKYEFIDLRLSLLDPTDLRGIPFFDSENKTSIWARPEFLPESESEAYGVLFLDEINSAPPTIQAAAYQLVLDRKIGEYNLPKNYAIVAAGNLESDRGVTYRMPTPLANRFVHLDFEIDFGDWKSWAYGVGIDARIIAYLNFKPQNLFVFDPSSNKKAFATPRSWSFVDTILKSDIAPELLKDVISGAIGGESSEEFLNFCNVMEALPPIEPILEGEDIEIPQNNSVLYALCSGIVYALKKSQEPQSVTNVLKFSLKLPNEFAVVLVKDIQREGIDVESNTMWKTWVDSNRYLLG